MPAAFYTKWPAFLRGLFSFFLPHNCPLCQSFVTDTGLCSDCWHGLRPITAPSCAAWGRPLAYALLHSLFAPCLIKPFKASKIRSGYCYDDVMTTGATLNSCTHTLLEAGANSVSALVFARVV